MKNPVCNSWGHVFKDLGKKIVSCNKDVSLDLRYYCAHEFSDRSGTVDGALRQSLGRRNECRDARRSWRQKRYTRRRRKTSPALTNSSAQRKIRDDGDGDNEEEQENNDRGGRAAREILDNSSAPAIPAALQLTEPAIICYLNEASASHCLCTRM